MEFSSVSVANGKIVVEGATWPEGTVVAVVSRGADEPFTLTREEEYELLAAEAEIDSGNFVTLDALLESLPQSH
jgi:hypothetical protein